MNDLFSRDTPDRRPAAAKPSAGRASRTAESKTAQSKTAQSKTGESKMAESRVGDPVAGRYDARDIEVLEGLEPVRRRPGMYIGGTDETALHHLAAEILDNAMDEAVAGHASLIEFAFEAPNQITVRDNGRGIPVDPHPKFTDRSALEVIFTTLHSGGKFSGNAYATSGGLHGVGSSVVNALSSRLEVEVARDRAVWRQEYERGRPVTPLAKVGATQNRRGTQIRFIPDTEIFGALQFSAQRLYRLCRSKAFLFRGVTLRWSCDASLAGRQQAPGAVPIEALLHFPGGLADSLRDELGDTGRALAELWSGEADLPAAAGGAPSGRLEWAIAWLESGEAQLASFCNTIPTPLGGTHETGFRNALLRGLRAWGEQRSNKRALAITAEDLLGAVAAKLSGVHPRSAFPGPDQGEADHPGGHPAGRDRAARPLRPLAGGTSGAGGQPARLHHRACRGTPPPARAEGHAAQIADAAPAPARQAHRLHP